MKHLRTLAPGWGLSAGLIASLFAALVSLGGITSAFAAPTVATTTTLSSATNPADVGTPVVLTATVTGSNPSGNVAFKNGTTTMGTVALTGTGNTRTATYSATITSAGAKSLTAVYAGDTLNITSTSAVLTQTVSKLLPSATLASSVNPVLVGTPTVLTATVTGYSPSGNVAFKNGTTTLGTVALTGTGNTRTATYSATITSGGAKSLTAVYAGNTNNLTVTSAAVAQTVDKANTTASLASSLNPATQGQSVTFTASVTGYNPTGNVVFKNGATTLSTKALSGSGNTRSTTLAITTLAAGAHSISADYVGDTSNNASSAAPIAQTIVGKTASTTALSSSANPSAFGQSITLTASVSGATPTGTVTFKNGTATLGSATITAGVASFTTSALAVGTRSLTAVYAGDTFNATSTSAAVSQVVTKATSTTTLTTSANPSAVGSSLTLTATVTGATPTGTVTFKDGVTTIGTGTITAGIATLSTSALSLGSHSLTAVYAGNTNNLASTSAVVSQAVTPVTVATTTTVSATPNPANVGANVTLSATVSGNNPSGLVTFLDGSTTLGSVPLSAGTASLSTSALSAGGHSITAQYAGDAGNQASVSSSVLVSINPVGIGAMTWRYGYDAMGRPTSTIDPNGLATYTYYDSLGRPIQTQQPANTGSSTPTVISLEYNLADSLTKVTDPRNLATTYNPNGLGNVTSQTSPDTGLSSYTYDAAGNVKTITDARGKVTTLAYDALDRVTSITYPTGTPTTLEYDGGASAYPGAQGELTKITDESGTTSYTYDSLGRLSSKTQTTATKTFTVGYTWGDSGSALDKLVQITYPSGTRVNYTYDAQGYRTAITVSPVNPNGVGTGAAQSLLSAIGYNADSQLTGWTWANGKGRTIGYDSFGQIASYSLGDASGTASSAGTQRSVIRDGAGRITGYSHTNTASPATAAALNQAFGYDNLNRLLSATVGNSITQYSYDATGNRTAKTIGGTTYSNTVSPTSNQYTQTQDATGTASVQYDAAGHITADGTNTFTYSDRGRMATASNAGGTVTYSYNAQELRVAKTGPSALVATGASYYVYDEQGKLLGEYDANQNPIYETIYLGNTPVGVVKQTGTAQSANIATSIYNVDADHLGTARVITRPSDNAIAWRWDTAEAFGATAPNQNPHSLGTFVYNPRFPGQVFDSETGLNQNWNREYNARLGRYIQSDPIGLAGGINTYGYAEANPLMFTDPYGLYSWGELGDDATNVAVGIGDGASFGLTRRIREMADISGNVDECSALYNAADIAGGLLPLARLGYLKDVLAIPGKFPISNRAAAEAAYNARIAAANYYRGFLGRFYRQKGSFMEYAEKYGFDWGQVIEAAGRSNLKDSAKIISVSGMAETRSAIDRNKCTCK